MHRFARATLVALSILMAGTSLSYAQGAPPAADAGAGAQCSTNDYLNNVAESESASSGGYEAVNSKTGYFGKYQMGRDALVDLGYASPNSPAGNSNIIWTGKNGIKSYQDFFGNHAMQEQIYREYTAMNWGYMEGTRLNNGRSVAEMVGQRLPNGDVITQSGLLKGSQFGVGTLQNYFNSGMNCGAGGTGDDNNTCVGSFIGSANGYDVSSLIGRPTDVSGSTCESPATQEEEPFEGDTTSKTCIPTVPMLQAIPCEKYPGSLQGFCYRYKPLQMNMAECQAAERWAENVPPSGPHLESCKEQTFGQGTSSWSYVHACAKAEPAMGAEGQDNENQKIIGAADDPACYQRLEAMGIEFEPLGKMDISTGGRVCIVANALQYSGGAVPFDRSVTLNCALVEQIERFGPQARSMGVTEYKVLGTLDCRGINNNKGSNQSKTTLHGFGNAIDINGFQVGSQLIKTSDYFSNPTRKGWLMQLRDMGCTVFDGTLAFNFYAGNWTHIHWQATEATRCDPPG